MTFQRVQVPIVNWVTLPVFVTGIGVILTMSGCQTGRESAASGNKPLNPLTQTAAVKSSPAPFLGPPFTPATVPQSSAPSAAPAPGSRLSAPPSAPAAQPSATTTGAQSSDAEDALHARVTRGRVVLFSSSEIVAVPARSVRAKNDPPSLMEDAIANSAIQTQLNADPGVRRAGVKCRTNAGVVTIRAAGDLTVAQQASALNAALQQSNVSEVHLVKQ